MLTLANDIVSTQTNRKACESEVVERITTPYAQGVVNSIDETGRLPDTLICTI